MKIPLYNRLRRQLHREIAFLQDQVVEAVYSLESNAVLHGGTAIWRCFNGRRFSSDLNFYFAAEKRFRKLFKKELVSRNLRLPKFKRAENTVFAKVSWESTTIQLEVALHDFKKPVVREYERLDGTSMDVFTPSVEELLVEKMSAFKARRLVRDIYDVYFLSGLVENPKALKGFAEQIRELPKPVDEKNLKALVLFGAAPSFKQMLQVLRRRFK